MSAVVLAVLVVSQFAQALILLILKWVSKHHHILSHSGSARQLKYKVNYRQHTLQYYRQRLTPAAKGLL